MEYLFLELRKKRWNNGRCSTRGDFETLKARETPKTCLDHLLNVLLV